MSLYQMVHGANPATFFILPMLGKHPDEYPRFRDCFTEERVFTVKDGLPVMTPKGHGRNDVICVLMRIGQGNWGGEYIEEVAALRAMDGYITSYDDPFDHTYATFVFAVPERWKEDYRKICEDQLDEISDAYKQELCRVYPKLSDKFEAMFR